MKKEPYRINSVEGKPLNYDQGLVQRETDHLSMLTDTGYEFSDSLDIVDTGDNEIVLGVPWLRTNNPQIDWITGQLHLPRQENEGSQIIPRRELASEKATEPSSNSGANMRQILVTTQKEKDAHASTSIPTDSIPKEYRKYEKLFQGHHDTGLPEHSTYDHEIPLIQGTSPRFQKIYPLNEEKQ